MASINLQGDTSGSISISAPSVAGSNTLTLPKTTQTLATENALGVRNLIINGNMRIAQRGTSTTGLQYNNDNNFPSCDRWQFSHFGSASYTAAFTGSRVSDSPSDQGFGKSFKMSCTTADATLESDTAVIIRQSLEGQYLQHLKYGTSNAEDLTLSFWVKSNLTGTFTMAIHHIDGGLYYGADYTIDTADTWEKKTITIPGDTTTAIADDNTVGMRLTFYLAVGSNYASGTNEQWTSTASVANIAPNMTNNLGGSTSNEWYITGVQLEVGDTATPFEHRPYDMELVRCQRYFEVREVFAGSYISPAFASNTTQASGMIFYHTKKRATPSISYTGTVGGFSIQRNANVHVATAVTFGNLGIDSSTIVTTIGTASLSGTEAVRCRGNGTREIHISAEL